MPGPEQRKWGRWGVCYVVESEAFGEELTQALSEDHNLDKPKENPANPEFFCTYRVHGTNSN